MRWDELFADLDGQLAAAEAAELGAEVADRTRGEVGALTLVDRARAAIGTPIRVQPRGQDAVAGMLLDVAAQWLLVRDAAGRDVLVPWSAVVSLVGLGAASAAATGLGHVFRRLGLSVALRAIARDRAGVVLGLVDGSVVTGTIDRVGRDFVEVGEHPFGEPRRRDQVQVVRTVAQAALATVTREA